VEVDPFSVKSLDVDNKVLFIVDDVIVSFEREVLLFNEVVSIDRNE
jgi:hypothetical protein